MPSELTPAEALALHRRGEIRLVDVRTDSEHAAGRIAGDVHVELSALSGRAGELTGDLPIVFYCRSGARSAMATEAFAASGFDARNMTGGLLEWHAQGLPLEPADGYVE